MKTMMSIILMVVALTSCKTQEMYELTDGRKITREEFNKIFDECIERAIKQMSKEDSLLLFDGVKVSIDTIPNN